MKRIGTMLFVVITVVLFLNIAVSHPTKACKDIIAVGDATDGDYNLLMKVRDPSRPGLQVLCIVPEGYEYTYHHPWTGKPINFRNEHKYIGIASDGDTIPNIVKSGMSLSSTGIAYGDADTFSNWINPTKNAWDDFDWIRYACEKADTEDEAIKLLTKDAVKKMHATGVSENLFVVGPNKGVVIEADAFRYKVKEINNGVVVMSNYPKELWKTQIINTLPRSRSFDTVVEKYVRNKGVVRLKSLYGIRIVEIGENFISVTPVMLIHAAKTGNLGVVTKINLGERKTVGYYSVELQDIDGNKAKVRVCYEFKAWEETMMDHIQPQYGSIDVEDMINWSRLHKDDLEDLRPMCQGVYRYEAVTIYKIPQQNYEILSGGWFSPNHACSSIYVPFHICDTEIYDPYETGEVAALSLELLDAYGHNVLDTYFSKAEEVFLHETEVAEDISKEVISDHEKLSSLFTTIDIGMQKQAFLTEQIWMGVSKLSNQQHKDEMMGVIGELWKHNYLTSLKSMKIVIQDIKEISGSTEFIEAIEEISLSICKSRIDALQAIGRCSPLAESEYATGSKFMRQGEHELGFDHLEKAFAECEMSMNEQLHTAVESVETEGEERIDVWPYVLIICLAIALFALLSKLRWKPD